MTNQDKEYLRDLIAMFALNGIIARGGLHPELMPEEAMARRSYEVADAMMKARNEEETIGLPAIKRKAKVK
jgi:hypothetical protein